ncbi:Ribose-5-phosphate isomerase A [Babesia sp. Xinjiang]|uniref:Ribose-5-phosphate isomerase A n=1 Tax=Babesia sp. Xinjiang TaxID=462227 RepID=UPI000A24373B|nr:Ribose-5-phosphate isomerase A [Babesia sp. Xinjiang]ORM41120.1 Ribose-5-phosphate isomerase A [Babesia sp. Xinjiang]
MDQQECMRLAAEYAVESYVRDGMIVGLGTGRTASHAVRHLARLIDSGRLRNVIGVATSKATQSLISELGIPFRDINESSRIDVALDGADAFDTDLNLIKGGGGALFREKLVELAADKLVIVVDSSKKAASHLLEAYRVPVEIVKFGHAATIRRILERVGHLVRNWSQRCNGDGSLYETDDLNVIIDVEFAPSDPARLDAELCSVHGVVCTGLFLGMASAVVIAHPEGNVEPPQSDPVVPSFYGEWRIIDEHEFMSPTAAAMRTESEYSQAFVVTDDTGILHTELRDLRSSIASPNNDIAERLGEINRETSEQLDKARRKFLAIESTWQKNNFQRYLDADRETPGQHLSHVDRKLAQAVREVVEMKRDAETALMELTKSVASVDSLIGKTNRLKRSTCTFRQQAYAEKKYGTWSFKLQLFIAAIVSFAGYTLIRYFAW